MSGVVGAPPLSALLVLVRHGQSERNIVKKQNRFYLNDEARKSVKGIPDHRIPLTDEGRRQASVTGAAIRASFGTFDYIIHSGYTRTAETTKAILAAYPEEERRRMPVRHHLFIRERDGGHAYDMTDAEAAAAFPWLQDYWNTFGPFFARPPGGESLAQVCERVYAFVGGLRIGLVGEKNDRAWRDVADLRGRGLQRKTRGNRKRGGVHSCLG
jgi:broad specificity phosphatase PhoE